jgi:hypothetical protein
MTDIQKAIKFAESEIKSLELAPKINGCEMTELWKEQIEVWKTAISALEKQIPKKPHEYLTNNYSCPICSAKLYPHSLYCYHCGQALDWSDTE